MHDLRRFAQRARSELSEQRFEQLQRLPQRSLEALAAGYVPRDGLLRTSDAGITTPDDGLTIEGYGGVTNQVTLIDSWEGTFEEEFLTGSFKRTARNQVPKMQFDHGQGALFGSVPMGTWTAAEEDDTGLHLGPGRVFDNMWTLPVRDAIAAGEISGMSIRFSVVRDKWIDRNGDPVKDDDVFNLIFWGDAPDRAPLRRQVVEAKVPEAGPVVWPAYAGTSVGLRSETIVIDLGRLNDPAQQRLLARAAYAADQAGNTSVTRDAQLTEGAPDTEHATEDRDSGPEAPPSVTAPPPEEHSSASVSANPAERAADIKARFRHVTDRVLALPPSSSNPKEKCA